MCALCVLYAGQIGWARLGLETMQPLPIPSDADITAATLKIDDLTARFRVKRQAIYRWIRDEGFPKPVKETRRTARWKPADVDAWVSEHVE
jgi:predicted DNA-binding transcriptional regulator AlpA